MEPVRAAIYARISQDRDDNGLGVQRQLADCEALAAAKGWVVVEPFVDNDTSAMSGKKRPQYERMLTSIRCGHVNGLVVWDIDRLTRTPRELEDIIDLAERHGTALASVGGEVDLATPQGKLTARLKGSVARHEADQASRRLRRKFLERAEDGKPHGKVPYGYRRQALLDDQGRQTGSVELLHEEQAAVLREATRRLLDLEPLRRIVADFNRRQIPTPRGTTWDGTMLRQVLLRERNAGRRVHQGQVIGKGNWPPVLEEEVFDRLVALLTDPARRSTRGNAVKHLLSGIARCGREDCDGTMRVVGRRTHANKTAPEAYNCKQCFRLRRKKVDVDAVVETVVVARLSQPDGPSLLSGDPAALEEAENEAAVIEARLALAADSFAEGNITAEQLTRITTKLRPQLVGALARAHAAAPSPELRVFSGPDIENAWADSDIEVKRAVIDTLMTVTLLPVGSGSRFDPQSVRIQWKS